MRQMADESSFPRYTVTSLTAGIRKSLEGGFKRIILDGEISGWRRYPSGHCYFTMKDGGAQISAVMFAGAYERCRAREGLKDGAKVSVFGSVTVYPPRGNYQINVLSAKLAGVGELMQRYLELKAKLEGEGLFDPARKRRLPFMPRRIGIVTSEAGAVIHDMCTVLMRRFPNIHVRLFPCMVQGDAAAATIAAGVRYFNGADWRPDLIIVARGGGSFEDLFCFNDEELVRTVAASGVPTISAVGHETDYTLCDFAADVRAGTPSIAAELAVPVLAEIKLQVYGQRDAMARALRARGEYYAQRVDHLEETLGRTLLHKVERIEARLEKAEARLEAYSPYGVLERGYTLTTTASGEIVREASKLRPGDEIETRFARGRARSVISGATCDIARERGRIEP